MVSIFKDYYVDNLSFCQVLLIYWDDVFERPNIVFGAIVNIKRFEGKNFSYKKAVISCWIIMPEKTIY